MPEARAFAVCLRMAILCGLIKGRACCDAVDRAVCLGIGRGAALAVTGGLAKEDSEVGFGVLLPK